MRGCRRLARLHAPESGSGNISRHFVFEQNGRQLWFHGFAAGGEHVQDPRGIGMSGNSPERLLAEFVVRVLIGLLQQRVVGFERIGSE